MSDGTVTGGLVRSATVAALYVDPNGVYAGLPGVEVWGEARDARRYAGPWPVVAHPPCARWSALSGMIEVRYGYRRGDDGGCFESALNAVHEFGGVLEHPAHSFAWKRYGLPKPIEAGWRGCLTAPGLSCSVEQGWYGHPLRKPTWLYAHGVELPELRWGDGPGMRLPHRDAHRSFPNGLSETQRKALTIPTPPSFRDVLLAMARTARVEVAA